MKRNALFIAAAVFAVLALLAAGCGDKPKDGGQAPAPTASTPKMNMQEGQWEITTTAEMQGMPAGMMKPHTFTTCLSQKDPIAKGKEQTDCKMQDLKTVGNTVSWTIVCPNATSKGTITYAGTSYDGLVENVMKIEGKEMVSKMTMKGKYVGPCPTPVPAPAVK